MPRKEVRFVLTVYADESSDPNEATVFAVGGLLGTDKEWADVEERWAKRMGGLVFHLADLEGGHKDFKNFGERERQRWYRDMVEIIDNSPLIALGRAVDLREFWDVFPDADRHSPYFLCFHHVIIDLAALGRVYLPPDNENIAFVFDQNQKYEYNAARLFDMMSHATDWRDHNRLDSITFASKEKRIGLQAADLVARETFKHRHNQLTSDRTTRLSMRKLAQGAHFGFFTRNDLKVIHRVAANDGNRKPLAEYAREMVDALTAKRTRARHTLADEFRSHVEQWNSGSGKLDIWLTKVSAVAFTGLRVFPILWMDEPCILNASNTRKCGYRVARNYALNKPTW